ncbi:IS481 family transposase [Streptomyces sp. NPDC096013]|uniref:IS481 family transposase n=1 Tax=Streptomyces sp. NPDC096013 TaxID=3366069 RepID=UPI00381BC36C
MSHANAALTPRARLKVAQLVVDQGVPIREVAARFQCSWPTVKRWASRYAAGQPPTDRSSRPHTSPAKTPAATTKRIVSLRLRKRIGPVQLAALTGVAPSTEHRVLRRCHISRLSYLDRATGDPVRSYEHPRPGAMIHVDVKKLGNIPDGGGWRFVGRAQGIRNRARTKGKPKNRHHNPKMGYAFVHSVIDDHSRVAYAEIHDDETAATAVTVLRRSVIWFADRGVTVERVLSDNGAAYVSHLWRDTCAELRIKHSRTRPRRPQTNGKIERFHRTLADGWGYARCYVSEAERRAALSAWLHTYNHHRPHTAIGNKPPITRLINLPGQYN